MKVGLRVLVPPQAGTLQACTGVVFHGLWSEGDDGLWRRSRGRMIARRLAASA